jgi:hypothetical protein
VAVDAVCSEPVSQAKFPVKQGIYRENTEKSATWAGMMWQKLLCRKAFCAF